MAEDRSRIRGRMRLLVRGSKAEILAERCAENIVLRQGAAIIAGLFAGSEGSGPIDKIKVGFGTEASDAELTALTPPPDEVPAAALASPIAATDFSSVLDRPDIVQVRVNAVFKPSVELKDVTEAGLMAGDKLYNQVVFEPVTLSPGRDITFFWEIDFPFGH